MKSIIGVVLAIVLAVPAMAQKDMNDPKAIDILKKVSQKYGAYSTMQVDFVQSIKGIETGATEEKKGTIYVKGDMYRLETKEFDRICNNKLIWDFMKGAGEVHIKSIDEEMTDIQPSKIFSLYDQNYTSLYISEGNANGKKIHVIDLTPNDKSMPFFKVRMAIEQGSNDVLEFKVFYGEGFQISYLLENFKKNPALADSKFSFNKANHPGIVEVDLR